VFARPTTPVGKETSGKEMHYFLIFNFFFNSIEFSSPLPPASFSRPTPDLQFTSTPAPKETICIEERYRFFDCDSKIHNFHSTFNILLNLFIGLCSDTDITDINVANLETEPLLPVQKSAEDEQSEDKSIDTAQMSSVCTSRTFRFEASSPDIFRPDGDRLIFHIFITIPPINMLRLYSKISPTISFKGSSAQSRRYPEDTILTNLFT
jgi:hypothetical protein